MENTALDRMFGIASEPHEAKPREDPISTSSSEPVQAPTLVVDVTPKAADATQYDSPSKHANSIIHMLSVDVLDATPNNPFKPYTEERFKKLCESISRFGIMQPLLVRPIGDRYQIFSGHNRWQAAMTIGFTEIPALIEPLNEEEAAIQMVEINLQHRDDLLPSEKAWAYRIKLEATRRKAGRPAKENSRQFVGNLNSADEVGNDNDESGRQVQRYIRLTYLFPLVLDMVDNKQLPFGAGIELSYLRVESQQLVYDYLVQEKKKSIDISLAQSLRKLDECLRTKVPIEQLKTTNIDELLTPQKTTAPKAVKLEFKQIKQYFAPTTSETEIAKTILKALEQYFAEVSHDTDQDKK